MGQFCLSDIVPYHVPILLKTANGISCKSISPKFEKSIRSFDIILRLIVGSTNETCDIRFCIIVLHLLNVKSLKRLMLFMIS